MRLIIATFVGLVGCTLYAATPAAALSAGDVVGTWQLVSDVRQAVGSDKVVNNLGENPTGILIITPENRFIVLFTAAGRQPAKTTEEYAQLQKTHIAYAGLVSFGPELNRCVQTKNDEQGRYRLERRMGGHYSNSFFIAARKQTYHQDPSDKEPLYRGAGRSDLGLRAFKVGTQLLFKSPSGTERRSPTCGIRTQSGAEPTWPKHGKAAWLTHQRHRGLATPSNDVAKAMGYMLTR